MMPSQPVKRWGKRGLQRATEMTSDHPAFIVASMGRSGSTVVYQSLIHAVAHTHPFLPTAAARRVISDQAWQLEGRRLFGGSVYKTHDRPPAHIHASRPVKAVFTYARPTAVVESLLLRQETAGADWVNEHLIHLGSNTRLNDALDRDALKLEEQLDAWLSHQPGIDVLALKYSALWTYEEALRDFFDAEIRLPPQHPRTSRKSLSSTLSDRLCRTYERLDARVEEMEPIQRFEPA